MRKYYFLQLLSFFFVSVFAFSSCQEKEDVVMPEETCDTLATVQESKTGDFQLRLENGEILIPTDVKTTASAEYEMEGFKVKKGQSIIIGFKTTGSANRNGIKGKLADINCIVGIKQKP